MQIGADHIPFLGGIALPAGQQVLKFLPELSQLLDLAIDPLNLAPQLDLDVVAGELTGVMNRQATLDLLQAEPKRFEATDERQSAQRR